MDVYETCPELSSGRFLLRQTCLEDRDDLLKVYSDLAAVPIFNSDNCIGDFYMTAPEDMENCIRFWLQEYAQRYYVRWTILDRAAHQAVGTVELFNRKAGDFYNNVGLLRLDLRSDYETEGAIAEIISILIPASYELFACDTIATKIPACAKVRRETLCALGFRCCSEPLRGHNGTEYGDYYIINK